MQPLPATQFPPSSNAIVDEIPTPAQFHSYLRSLLSDTLAEGSSTRIPPEAFEKWVALFTGLSDNFLSFPLPGELAWSAFREKVELIESSLEVIRRASSCVKGIFIGPTILDKILARLLDLCNVFEVWRTQDTAGDGVFTPFIMKEKAFTVLVGILRGLGNSGTTDNNAMWTMSRKFLSECLALVHDIVVHAPPLTPITLLFYNEPRFRAVVSSDMDKSDSPNIIITTTSQLDAFAIIVLEVITSVLGPAFLSQWFFVDLIRRTSETIRLTFDYYLSPACSTTFLKRIKLLARTVVCGTLLFQSRPELAGPVIRLPYRLLRFRLDAMPTLDVDAVDITLQEAFRSSTVIPSPHADIGAALDSIRTELGDAHKGIRALVAVYIRGNIPLVGGSTLKVISEAISIFKDDDYFAAINTELEARQRTIQGASGTDAAQNSPNPTWRKKVRAVVDQLMFPDQAIWTDEEEDSTDLDFAQYCLNEIKLRFERPLDKTETVSRISLAQQLSSLVTQFDRSESSDGPGMRPLATISAGLAIVLRLLDGPEAEVTADVRRQALSSFAQVIRHHAVTTDLNGVEYTANVIFTRLRDLDRSVRLSAGRALVALTHMYGTSGQRLEPVFDLLYHHLDTEKLPMKETLLISVGLMGKTPDAEILGHVLCLLVAQIAKQNPVIKGSAYTQILALTKHHNKSVYSLLHPHLERIAPFLVSRMCTQPGLLVECCLLMALNPTAFIERTLPFTLPQLYGNCEAKVLQKIAKDLGIQSSALFLESSAIILAHIFRLQGPGQTNKALAFVVKILIDETGKEGVTLNPQHIVLSCIVSLTAELVIGMGDEPGKAAVSVAALHKVERCLAPASNKNRTLNKPDLGAFLKTYMLGVMTNITDMLQELQGKKTVATKCMILRSLGAFVDHIGVSISNIAPQIMATFQTNISIPELSEATLQSWHTFLTTLGPTEIGPHIGPTTAVFLSSWPVFSPPARALAIKSLEYIIVEAGPGLGKYLDDVVDISSVSELRHLHERMNGLRIAWTPQDHLQRILERATSDNLTVAHLSLVELKTFMLAEQKGFIHALASGDMFDPMVGQILGALVSAACRDADGTEALRLLAFECIGVLGAVDPDRCEINLSDSRMIVFSNFTDEGEAVLFALHLIQDVLVGAFRSTSDIKYQGHLAYTIQELLKFCQFTPSVVDDSSSVPLKVRKRWKSLPKQVLSTVTPLLEGRFNLGATSIPEIQHPIYPTQSTYREWIQLWTSHLITKAAGPRAQNIFSIFRLVVRSRDVVVAHHLLPHLVLNILISGDDDDKQAIREELLAVLEDQVSPESDSTADKKLLSAQAVFMLLDHLNGWVRVVRQDIGTKKAESKRSRTNRINSQAEEQLLRVDSILSNIDQNLMAKAALQCKAYARALMNFERQILTLQERSPQNKDLPTYYERLHEIYSHLDEPDGMEGVSTLILSPSLEHQIRQHESIGRWTSAQSCWEVRLQQSPNNIDFHLGLLRCLRNLGHFDTLRTHVSGVLLRNPEWGPALVGFEVESAWMVGAWDDVQRMVDRTEAQTSHIVIARLLLAMRARDDSTIAEALSVARSVLGAPITAAGVKGYRRSYEAILDLHLTHELEIIHNTITSLPPSSQGNSQRRRRQALTELSFTLSARFDATLPTFRTREPLLSMRRTAFSLSPVPRPALKGELGRSWLASAKIARKAGQKQTAYSAMLQAQQNQARFSFMESAKLVKAAEPLRAVQELENSMRLLGLIDDKPMVLDLTEDDDETTKMKAKAQVLRARWMNESDRYEVNAILKSFQMATELQPTWESCHYHLGQFHDECFKNLPRADQVSRGMRMNLYTVRSFAKAIKFGSKYVYQTVPRLLTIWLDLGEERTIGGTDVFKKLNDVVSRAIKEAPTYKWFTAFPQIVSRVGHTNPEVYQHLSKLIVKVMEEYPKQALWLFTSVVKSTKPNREQRGKQILDQLRSHPNNAQNQVPMLINQCVAMTNELLALCDYPIDDESSKTLTMAKHFPKLAALGRSPLIIPLQESLTVSLPPTSSSESIHQPFPTNAPTFEEFFDEIDIMRSLAKPRKITIRGSNGQIYMFLGKPKDDLRKDARLMDFNAIINKLLKANSESRRRQLHIRTYGVVTLNEECGFIQWVPNTIPIRPVLMKAYEAMKIRGWSGEMSDIFKKIKDAKDKEGGDIFVGKILPMFPPIFHDWFVETFPEPTAWLASRLSYGRTAAVMSMVGFILGLGDRHCENILLDSNTGDVVHVDFNCLFEKGKTLETPERVPFRLTQNMIDGLGITGVEGVFRIACEVTMQLLRDNKDSLMSVLDAFIHDPLVEWEDEKRKLEREPSRRINKANLVKSSVDLRMLAKNALSPIEKKLKGVYSTSKERQLQEKEISTSNLVQMLIQEATDSANLGKMYPGWAAWH